MHERNNSTIATKVLFKPSLEPVILQTVNLLNEVGSKRPVSGVCPVISTCTSPVQQETSLNRVLILKPYFHNFYVLRSKLTGGRALPDERAASKSTSHVRACLRALALHKLKILF